MIWMDYANVNLEESSKVSQTSIQFQRWILYDLTFRFRRTNQSLMILNRHWYGSGKNIEWNKQVLELKVITGVDLCSESVPGTLTRDLEITLPIL